MSLAFDSGLQPERTELAWRRTALSLALGSLVALRLLPEMLDSVLWITPGLVGLLFALTTWVAARRRYRSGMQTLERPRRNTSDGGFFFITSATTAFIGALGLVIVVIAATAPPF